MPYYIGEGTPEWDVYLEQAESEGIDAPELAAFEYVDPWRAKASVLSFQETPGAEPIIPDPPQSPLRVVQPVVAPVTQGFFARVFGRQPTSAQTPAPAPEPSPEQWQDWRSKFEEREDAIAKHALWKISGLVAKFRAAGVKRVVGAYDGGGDESFTHFRSVEMNDGRVILEVGNWGLDYSALIDDAASAIMGRFDAGEFMLRGVLTIDFVACTITDEKNAEVVFGPSDKDLG